MKNLQGWSSEAIPNRTNRFMIFFLVSMIFVSVLQQSYCFEVIVTKEIQESSGYGTDGSAHQTSEITNKVLAELPDVLEPNDGDDAGFLENFSLPNAVIENASAATENASAVTENTSAVAENASAVTENASNNLKGSSHAQEDIVTQIHLDEDLKEFSSEEATNELTKQQYHCDTSDLRCLEDLSDHRQIKANISTNAHTLEPLNSELLNYSTVETVISIPQVDPNIESTASHVLTEGSTENYEGISTAEWSIASFENLSENTGQLLTDELPEASSGNANMESEEVRGTVKPTENNERVDLEFVSDTVVVDRDDRGDNRETARVHTISSSGGSNGGDRGSSFTDTSDLSRETARVHSVSSSGGSNGGDRGSSFTDTSDLSSRSSSGSSIEDGASMDSTSYSDSSSSSRSSIEESTPTTLSSSLDSRVRRLAVLMEERSDLITHYNTQQMEEETIMNSLNRHIMKALMHRHLVPSTDKQCSWSYWKERCEPSCVCSWQYKFGDLHPGRSCRLKPISRGEDPTTINPMESSAQDPSGIFNGIDRESKEAPLPCLSSYCPQPPYTGHTPCDPNILTPGPIRIALKRIFLTLKFLINLVNKEEKKKDILLESDGLKIAA